MIVVQRCHRGAREGPPGVPTPDTISTRSVHGKRHSAVGCSQLPSPGSVGKNPLMHQTKIPFMHQDNFRIFSCSKSTIRAPNLGEGQMF